MKDADVWLKTQFTVLCACVIYVSTFIYYVCVGMDECNLNLQASGYGVNMNRRAVYLLLYFDPSRRDSFFYRFTSAIAIYI